MDGDIGIPHWNIQLHARSCDWKYSTWYNELEHESELTLSLSVHGLDPDYGALFCISVSLRKGPLLVCFKDNERDPRLTNVKVRCLKRGTLVVALALFYPFKVDFNDRVFSKRKRESGVL